MSDPRAGWAEWVDEQTAAIRQAGRWRELVNTDGADYGGSGVGNLGVVDATADPWHGQPASAVLTLPPMAVLWLVPEDDDAEE